MQEIGELALQNGWRSYIAYGKGRDGIKTCKSETIPVAVCAALCGTALRHVCLTATDLPLHTPRASL